MTGSSLTFTKPEEHVLRPQRSWITSFRTGATHGCSGTARTGSRYANPAMIPRRRGGTDAESNLQGMCHDCHSRKTALEDGRWGN